MKALEYILDKYNLNIDMKMPLVIQGGKNRELPSIFKNVGYKVGVEVGVQAGAYSETLCKQIPGLKLYSIDPWVSYGWYARKSANQDKMDRWYREAIVRLKPYNCEVIRGYSKDVVHRFEDNSLDFVFIDGNHGYEYVLQDIKIWTKKVRAGGIVSGHDFFNDDDPDRCSVKDAVQEWVKSNNIKTWFILKGKKQPSWFWVKEDLYGNKN